MPEIPVPVTPPVMRWLREAAGVELDEAAAKVHKDRATVEAWETGREMPPVTSLERLAGLYRKPLAAFLLDHVPEEPDVPVDYRMAWGHGAGALGSKVRRAIARARQVQHATDELLRSLSVDVALPKVTVGDIEGSAAGIRSALGVTIEAQMGWLSADHAIHEWRRAVESLNAVVLELSMPTGQVRAFSIASSPPVIAINRLDSSHGQIFSLFHELGHVLRGMSGLCLPQGGLRSSGPPTAPATLERWCNDLAGAILIPADALRAMARVTSFADLIEPPSDGVLNRISSQFRTSRFVLWYRLRDLKLIGEEMFRAKWAQWPNRAPDLPRETEGGGGQGLTRAERSVTENGPGFASLVLDAVAEGRISASSALDYLDVQLADLTLVARQVNRPAG
jgi:Zn-dependent peptidase ImmA (M78 family)/transcriptional regulator with XRE-family HTH domain